MTDWYSIQQFEYRWQPAKDLSLIAGSLPTGAIQTWSDRIALWVRHRAVKAPVASVRYEIFDDGMAALAWRQRDAQPIESGDGTESRPEVSRVLMGPVGLLRPEVAVTVCLMGLPEAIGPRLGKVAVHDALPAINPAALTRLADDTAAQLDTLAMSERGLDRVIAAALTDCDTALAVQLPERVIERRLQEGSQGPLLWGLWRTVWPLLGTDSGQRSWSFSTYEPPPGDVKTEALADIVFRTMQAVQPGLSNRREVLVRPHDPTEPPNTILYQDFARLLIDAYRHMGGEKLARHLDAVAGEYPSVDQRIEGVAETLYAILPAEALSVPRRPHVPPAAPSPPPAPPPEVPSAEGLTPAGDPRPAEDPAYAESLMSAEGADWRKDMTSAGSFIPPAPLSETDTQPQPQQADPFPPEAPVPGVLPSGATAQSPVSTMPAGYPVYAPDPAPSGYPVYAPDPAPSAPPVYAPPSGASNRSKEAAPSLSTAGSRPGPAGAAPPYTMRGLLDQLSAGPADPRFESAMQLVRDGKFPSEPADRAAARKLIAERDWYLPVLVAYDHVHFDDALEAIFRHVVIPDLGRPEMTEELSRWAAAPPPVIKALNAAAQGGAAAPEQMRQALEAPLGRRWLTEHGIYTGSSGYAGPARRSQGAHAASSSRSQWDTLLDGALHGDPLSVLALCSVAVLVAVLVLVLLR